VTIRDLNREFHWDLPDEDYSTIAGLLIHEAKIIPNAGQSFSFYGFQFDVVKRHRNQITLVRVMPDTGVDQATAP
jgi:Mg2+/Co2+ transporter CorB